MNSVPWSMLSFWLMMNMMRSSKAAMPVLFVATLGKRVTMAM